MLTLLVMYCNRYPDKDAQYHFFRNYLESDKPHEVYKLDGIILHLSAAYLCYH